MANLSLESSDNRTINDLTVAEKRELLERAKSKKLKRTAIDKPETIELVSREHALLLSFAQQRLWFLDQLEDSVGQAYHISGGVKITGRLDKEALQAALDQTVIYGALADMMPDLHLTVLELNVAKSDLGKVIGKKGRNANAIRTILMAAGNKNRKNSI